jgi:hypothetical protein
MLVWIPIATNQKSTTRGKQVMPPASAAVVGSNVVLRFYELAYSVSTTTVAFASEAEATAWVAANRAMAE